MKYARKINRSRQQRRGVTLMLVLALMSLFAMLVVTFMIVTTQARNSAESAAKALLGDLTASNNLPNQYAVGGNAFDRPSLQKLLVGDDMQSVIGPYSILENLYGTPEYNGNDPLAYTFNNVNLQNDGEFLQVEFAGYDDLTKVFANNYRRIDLIGHVLTIDATDSSGLTDVQRSFIAKSSIVHSVEINASNDRLWLNLLPFSNVKRDNESISSVQDQYNILRNICNDNNINTNFKFIINTPAFSGTGPGFNRSGTSGSALLTEKDDSGSSGVAFALRPNFLAPGGGNSMKDHLADDLVLMNPDYTAPDTRNLFLAWYDIDDTTNPGEIKQIIPSFHRPQLISSQNPSDWNALRKLVLRPLPGDHPNFSGSNPALDLSTYPVPSQYTLAQQLSAIVNILASGPLDVDNDNDGIADGVWLNIGLDPITHDNKQYLPLVSFLVRDLDGRLNVNVHGNLAQADSNFGTSSFFTGDDKTKIDLFTDENGSPASDAKFAGSGSGPADVRFKYTSTSSLPVPLTQQQLKDMLETGGRYGNTTGPGDFSNDATFIQATISQNLMGINPKAYGYDNSSAGSVGGQMPDWFGSSPLVFDPLGNRAVFSFFGNGVNSNVYAYNPYLLDPYTASTRFSEKDMELDLILRSPGDRDYNELPVRLRKLLNDNLDTSNNSLPDPAKWSEFQHYLTTISSDIPVFSRFGGSDASGSYTGLYAYIRDKCNSDSDAQDIYAMLPEEVRRGEKINLNKLTLDPDWVDDSDHNGMLKKKMQFANGIFLMLVLIGYDELYPSGGGTAPNPQDLARLAQWSVNLVDFIDADAVLTPFLYSDDPIVTPLGYSNVSSGTGIDDFFTDTGWTLPSDTQLVWGFEKPQVALTETLAVHNRRVANASEEGVTNICTETNCKRDLGLCVDGCTGEHAETFRQVLDPEASLFVELYHSGNPARANRPDDGFGTTNQIDLAGFGDNAPVWRMVVGGENRTFADPNILKNTVTWSEAGGNENDFLAKSVKADFITKPSDTFAERYIWFVNETDFNNTETTLKAEATDKSFFENGGGGTTLEPNEYLVVGPRNKTSFASKPVDSDETTTFGIDVCGETLSEEQSNDDKRTRILLTELQNDVGCKYMIADNTAHGVNISAPLKGYESQSDPSKPYDDLCGYGTVPCYKTILLQRLADPLRPYNVNTNPYVTVDWSVIDLHVINSESNETEYEDGKQIVTWDNESDFEKKDLYFSSRQWGYTGMASGDMKSDYPNLWIRVLGTDGQSDYAGLKDDFSISGGGPRPDWKYNRDATLGELNPFITKNNGEGVSALEAGDSVPSEYVGAPEPGFMHFPWNDAPLANTFELMMVPACSYDRFCLEFYDTGTDTAWDTADSLGNSSMRFANPSSGIGPYLNFFHSASSGSLNLARLFEYVRVPSRFAGTIRGWTVDDKPIYSMREPGKINLNTMTETAWNALTAEDSSRYKNYSNLKTVREGSASMEAFAAPFRSPQSFNLVGDSSLIPGNPDPKPADTTLLRTGTGSDPFVEPNAGYAGNEDGTNPYMELENVMRLSDVTTTRSNVFAIWMTIGFFEATKYSSTNLPSGIPSGPTAANFDAIYPDGYVLGKEKGLDDGTVQRLRSFYIIDRSIPVGFRRGQKLNSENVILNPTKTTLD